MAQVFGRHMDFVARLVGLGVIVLAAGVFWIWRTATAAPHPPGSAVAQPIPFSHKHHVGDDGIDCRYCHASVETAATAGMPSVEVCMSCHAQLYTDQPALRPLIEAWQSGTPLRWQRVHDLPDFAYFDHSVHVNHGVGCVSCHGRVDEMPLTWRHASLDMQWCLDCHRDPAQALRPRDKVFDLAWQPADQRATGTALIAAYHVPMGQLTECSTCHR